MVNNQEIDYILDAVKDLKDNPISDWEDELLDIVAIAFEFIKDLKSKVDKLEKENNNAT